MVWVHSGDHKTPVISYEVQDSKEPGLQFVGMCKIDGMVYGVGSGSSKRRAKDSASE